MKNRSYFAQFSIKFECLKEMAEQVSSTCEPPRVSVPWMIKTGRPYALPGCQDTSILPELPEGETDCGECNPCYFYRCRKCLPILLLEVLVPECRTEMIYIPDIGSIKPQRSDMFAENSDYHGEVAEFFANYLRRMDKLEGIAINSWSNKDARKIFLNTERTFDATKYEGSEDFEIDWLIFTNSTMAVVEVGMRCEAGEKDSGKKSNNRSEEERIKKTITDKVVQMMKDTIIIRKLLEAANSSGTLVYFLAVFPNIAFETVQRRIHFHKESLDSLFQPTNNLYLFKFGVVSNNTIPERTVHLYDQEGRFKEPTDFETLLTERTGQNQMYLASTVVSCMLMTSLAKKQNSTEASEFVIQKSSNVFPPGDEKKLWPKTTAMNVLGLPSKNRSKRILFPEELLLGPDQIKAIKSEADGTFIFGEAGTGKTLVLLALLFKYTGKHVSEKKLRQVVFCIPKNKIQFRKDVDLFIKKYCQEDWVEIRETFDGFLICSDNIYLVDEFYDLKETCVPFGAKLWVVAVSTSSEPLFGPFFGGSIEIIYLQKLYRSDPFISKLCAKISRLVYQKGIESNDEFLKIPWAMSTGDGIPYKSQNPIQVHSNQKNFNLKLCENEQNLVVYWNEEDFIEKSSQEKSKEIICHLEGYSLDDLVFTGSEFDNVVLVAGRNIDTTSQEFLIVLYKIISRARKTLTVFSHPSNLAEFESLIKFSDTDVYFDKQRYDNNFSSIAFSNLSSSEAEDIKWFKWSQFGKFSVAMTALEEDPQSLCNKAFVEYLKADEKVFFSTMPLSADRLSSMLKDFNVDLHGLVSNIFTALEAFGCSPKDPWFEPGCPLLKRCFVKSSAFISGKDLPAFIDILGKLVDTEFSNVAELRELVFRVDEFPFPEAEQYLLHFFQYVVIPALKFNKDTMGPFFFKSMLAYYLLNAEQFWRFLKKQTITLEKLFTKCNGYFVIIRIALSKLNPDQFTELLTSVGVDSLKLSDEQFLDDYRNNILMYCVSRTTHFCIVADWALKRDCLDEMLSHRNFHGYTCFVLACAFDNFVSVKMLLQKYYYDWLRDGYNAISALSEHGNMLIFKYLLSTLKGENVKMKLDSMRGSIGESILMRTTFNTKMMETFLNFLIEEKLFNILLYEKDALGFTCLSWAAAFQNIESIKMLIERYKYNWKTDRYIQGQTKAHIICLLEKPDALKFFVANYGHEFTEVAQELDYAGSSCLEIACLFGRSVEVIQMVLNRLNDSFYLPQNFKQLFRCLFLASKGNGENKNKILDCLVSHMLEKLSLGYCEDEIKQHYLVYASDSEAMLKIGVRILVGPEELEEADFGEPETFSLGSWECNFGPSQNAKKFAF